MKTSKKEATFLDSHLFIIQQKAAISKAQKPKFIFQSVLINFFPILSYPSCDKEQQGTFRLVKICNNP
jgi:hypothetical protein